MNNSIEIEIPAGLAEDLLQAAAEWDLPVESVVEAAVRIYLEGVRDNGRG